MRQLLKMFKMTREKQILTTKTNFISNVLLLFVFTVSIGYCETKPLNQYNLKCYHVANGLPQNSVTDINISQNGHLIVTTYAGVVSFDGDNFADYIPNSDQRFPKMEAWSVAVDFDGSLWIGTTTSGVYKFNGNERKHWDISNGLKNNMINDVIIGKHVYVFNDNLIFQYQPDNKSQMVKVELPDESVGIYNAFLSADKHLMMTSVKGIWKYKSDKWEKTTFNFSNEEMVNFSTGISVDADTVYLAYINKIIQLKNGKTSTLIPELIKGANVVVRSMMIDSQGDLWISTNGNGLLRYSKFGIEKVNNLPAENVTSFVEDEDGFLWIGTPSGLCSIHFDPMRSITQLNGLQNNYIHSIAKDKLDNVFVVPFVPSTTLNYIEGDTVHGLEIKTLDVKNGERINVITVNEKNQIIIATNKRLGQLTNDNNFDIIDEAPGGYASIVHDKGSLWYANKSTLFKYQNGEKKEIFSDKSSDNKIYGISKALSSQLLVGMHHGVYHIREDIPVKVDIDNNFTFCVREFVKDELWVCSEGLYLRTNNKNYHFGFENGITEGHIHDVVSDEMGNIWVTTNSGLYRILRKDIDVIKQGKEIGKVFTRFDESYGMKSSEFNGSTNGAIATDDGRLWFAGQSGVTIVDSRSFLNTTKKIINPFIEHMYINGEIVPRSKWQVIAANPKTTVINFSAIYLSDAKNLSFRYKLMPHNSSWQSGKEAHFTELKQGKYELQVQVRHRDKEWSLPVSAQFEILPAWYQAIWFRLVTFLILAIVMIGLPLWRIYWLKQKRIELKRLVSEKTASLTIANKKLHQLSRSDELTNIANRREFISQLDGFYKKPDEKICLALLDIDDFKAYNDYYGHVAGDECLVAVAKLLDKMSSDCCMVARFGGEEFVLLFNNIDLVKAELIINKTYEKLAEMAIEHERSSILKVLSFSTGLVERKPHESTNSIINRADIAMYKAKANGKNRLVVN